MEQRIEVQGEARLACLGPLVVVGAGQVVPAVQFQIVGVGRLAGDTHLQPALADAGLEAGDVILSFASRKVTPSNLFELMQMLEDDGTRSITLEVADEDTVRSITIEKAFLF